MNFWKRFLSWSLPTKIGLVLAVLGLFGGTGFVLFKITINHSGEDKLNIVSSSLIESPIFQDSPNSSVTYERVGAIDPSLYSQVVSLNGSVTRPFLGGGGNFYNYKVILPDKSEAYLKELSFGKRYQIAQCNQALTECQVYNAYKYNESYDKTLCWQDEVVASTTATGVIYMTEKSFSKNPNQKDSDCFTLVQPLPKDYLREMGY